MSLSILNIAVRAANEAAHVIRVAGARMHQISVEEKGPNDFVTEVDRNAETAIIETILETFPKHSFLSEERGFIEGEDSEWLWVIDPLDGTSNFIHGFPHYAVSIACARNGRLCAGVIVDVTRNQYFTVSRGDGVLCDQRRIRVSGCKHIARGLVCTGVPTRKHLQGVSEEYIACLTDVASACSGVRRSGSAALDLAWVAAGRLDGFFEVNLKPWDIAAGALMIQEAGGIISDFQGGERFLFSGNTLCGSPHCYSALLPIVNKHLGDVNVQDEETEALHVQLFGTERATKKIISDTTTSTARRKDEDTPDDSEELPEQTTTAGIKKAYKPTPRRFQDKSETDNDRESYKPRRREFGESSRSDGDRKPYGSAGRKFGGSSRSDGDRKPYGSAGRKFGGSSRSDGDRKPYGSRRREFGGSSRSDGDRKPYGSAGRKFGGSSRSDGDRKPYGSAGRKFGGSSRSDGDRKPYGSAGRKFGGSSRSDGDRKPYGSRRREFGESSRSDGDRKPYGSRRREFGESSRSDGDRKPYGSAGRKFGGSSRSDGDRKPYGSAGRKFGGSSRSDGDRKPYGSTRGKTDKPSNRTFTSDKNTR